MNPLIRRWFSAAPALLLAAGLLFVACAPATPLVGQVPRAEPAGAGPHGTHAEPGGAAVSCEGPAELDLECQTRRYSALTRSAGPAVAIAELKAAYARSGFVRGACHELVHAIGHSAGERYGDVAAAYLHGDPFCAGGYYHGAAEAVMVATGSPQVAMAVCATAPGGRAPIEDVYCAHGMGHGFMALLDRDVPAALAACDALPARWAGEHCYGGVFMENVFTLGDTTGAPRHLRPDEPLYPCTVLDARYKTKCYEKQTGYALYLADGDFTAVFALCASTPDVAFRPACNFGLGDRAAVRSVRLVLGDAAAARTVQGLCLMGGDDRARADCVAGAVHTLVRHGDRDPLVEMLCASLDQPALAARCAGSRDEAVREYGRNR